MLRLRGSGFEIAGISSGEIRIRGQLLSLELD